MSKSGTIKRIEGKYVWISLAPLGCCGGQAGGACHCSSSTTEVEFKAVNPSGLSLSPGDFVEVTSPTGAAWAGVVRLLVIPVGLLILGLVFFTPLVAGVAMAAGVGLSLLFPQSRDSGYPHVDRIIPVGDFTPFTAQA